MRVQKLRAQSVRAPTDDDDGRDSAEPIIDGTRSFLWSQNISKRGTWFKDDAGSSKISRKLFGRAPWHRKGSDGSFSSVGSSVREVLRGGTPPATPISMYTAVDCTLRTLQLRVQARADSGMQIASSRQAASSPAG